MPSIVTALQVPPGVSGRLYGFSYLNESTGLWTDLDPSAPPNLVLGEALHLVVWWLNSGSVSMQGHVDVTITKPNGQKVAPSAVFNQDKSAAPGFGKGVQFSPVMLDVSGTWRAEVVLSAVVETLVTVTLKARNAPSNAQYWIAMCGTYPSCSYTPIGNSIIWQNIPGSTPQNWVMFGAYDAAYGQLATPNAWHGVGFARAFENGKTYYWDFQSGLLLDENLQWM